MTHIDDSESEKQELVQVPKLALMALINGTLSHVHRYGHYANRNRFGRIEIADALRQACEPMGLSYDPSRRSNYISCQASEVNSNE